MTMMKKKHNNQIMRGCDSNGDGKDNDHDDDVATSNDDNGDDVGDDGSGDGDGGGVGNSDGRATDNNQLNSLTPKSVPAGTKNSRSEGFLLAKHKHTNIPTMMEPFSSPAAWF